MVHAARWLSARCARVPHAPFAARARSLLTALLTPRPRLFATASVLCLPAHIPLLAAAVAVVNTWAADFGRASVRALEERLEA